VSDVDTLRGCWTAWATRHADDVDDILELRRTIETRIAWLAAERCTADEMSAIQNANAMISETHTGVLRWNAAFHDAVAAASHSRELSSVMVAARGKLFLPVDIALREHRLQEIRSDHDAIAEAISAGNPSAAASAMGDHIEAVRGMMQSALRG
jgi:GntR family transcriptional repressor for pyruvate dehydrogenase complex